MALSQLVGGWTKFGMPRLSLGTFLLGFLPVLVVVGWVACATQPHGNTVRSHVLTWSSALAINHIVDHLGEYIAVLSFGLGLVLGFCGDTVGVTRREEVYAGRRAVTSRLPMRPRKRDLRSRRPTAPCGAHCGSTSCSSTYSAKSSITGLASSLSAISRA